MYDINFDYLEKGNWRYSRYASCFQSIYRQLELYDEIKVYVKRNFPHRGNSLLFTDDEITEYFKLFKDLGIIFDIENGTFADTSTTTRTENGLVQSVTGECPCIIFTLYPKKDVTCVTKLMLNAIRNLHEYGFPLIVSNYLYSLKIDCKLSNWNKFFLANNCVSGQNSNHMPITTRTFKETSFESFKNANPHTLNTFFNGKMLKTTPNGDLSYDLSREYLFDKHNLVIEKLIKEVAK